MKAVLLSAITMSAVASAAVAESGELTTGLRPPALTASQTDALGHALGGEAEPLPAADDGPVRLAAAQMDAITAGLVSVDVTGFAAAQGADAFVGTDVRTDVASNEWIEVAYGTGDAYAIGDDTAVDVATSVYGDGDHVTGGTFRFVVNRSGHSLGQTMGFVVVVDADHPRFEFLRRKFDSLASHLERGYERRVDRLQRVSERLAARGDRGEQRLAGFLGWESQRLAGFVERGYQHFLRIANREDGRAAGQRARRSGE